ncbi:putative membrane protein [Lutibacter oceani]|uniref:Putative membrane protein n=1 Tax=Lutibacter oceani TaxID=1853311 RepID=A0A3D9RQV9_9FLAO|nr:DMT family transporter [Lutibacter oceani]REE82187.1 putative membrane protein [Lutibacter oceani]
MKISNSVKGFLWALISVIAVSNVYIFSKAALTEVSLAQFGVYWFSFGLIWILIYGIYKNVFKSFKELSGTCYLVLIFLGFIEVIGTYYFFKAIHTISNPTIVSFIGNISPVFIIILSFILLQERFSKIEFVGMILALLGAFIISYKPNTNFKNMFINGSQYVLYSSSFAAISAVIIKKKIKKINPIILTVNRSLFLLIFSILALNFLNDSLVISTRAVRNIFIGSLLGPFLTVISGYLALQYIPLSRRAIIASTKGLFVLLGSYLYFNQFPPVIALAGGIVTILGLLLIALGRFKKFRV